MIPPAQQLSRNDDDLFACPHTAILSGSPVFEESRRSNHPIVLLACCFFLRREFKEFWLSAHKTFAKFFLRRPEILEKLVRVSVTLTLDFVPNPANLFYYRILRHTYTSMSSSGVQIIGVRTARDALMS